MVRKSLWLGRAGGCLIELIYIVIVLGAVSMWLLYAGGCLIEVAVTAGLTV